MKTEKINAYDCLWEYLLVFLKIVKGNEKSANLYIQGTVANTHAENCFVHLLRFKYTLLYPAEQAQDNQVEHN